jgi:6-pyruvoyltetrahydropterin/6-carboxytetrahydropterin synthase
MDPGAIVYFSRIEHFSAAHRLNSTSLSDSENLDVYGHCNRVHGHGHNYKVEFSVKGHIDPRTGMVIPLDHLKDVVKRKVLDLLDHSFLDQDIAWFESRPSTTENLAIFIWRQVYEDLLPWRLCKVKVWETDNNIVSYKGECE